jgi:hypothetical protein
MTIRYSHTNCQAARANTTTNPESFRDVKELAMPTHREKLFKKLTSSQLENQIQSCCFISGKKKCEFGKNTEKNFNIWFCNPSKNETKT